MNLCSIFDNLITSSFYTSEQNDALMNHQNNNSLSEQQIKVLLIASISFAGLSAAYFTLKYLRQNDDEDREAAVFLRQYHHDWVHAGREEEPASMSEWCEYISESIFGRGQN